MLSDETFRTLIWGFVFLSGIQAAVVYCTVRLMITGKGMFNGATERDREHDDRPRVVGIMR